MKFALLILSSIPVVLFGQGYIGEWPSAIEERIGMPVDIRDAILPRDYEIRVYRGKEGGPMIRLYVASDGKVHAVELSSWVENHTDRPNPHFADMWAPLPKIHVDAFLEAAAENLKWMQLSEDSAPFILRRADGKVAVRLERSIDANGRLESAKLAVASKDFCEAMTWIPGDPKPKY